MAIKTTRWKPDTCACVIDYEWDTTLSEADRVHTAVNVIPCQVHAGLATPQQRYDTALLHCRRKNRLREAIMENISGVRDTLTDQEGNTYYEFKPGKSVSWLLRVDGVYEITAVGFTDAQKTAARTWISNNMPGEIVIL